MLESLRTMELHEALAILESTKATLQHVGLDYVAHIVIDRVLHRTPSIGNPARTAGFSFSRERQSFVLHMKRLLRSRRCVFSDYRGDASGNITGLGSAVCSSGRHWLPNSGEQISDQRSVHTQTSISRAVAGLQIRLPSQGLSSASSYGDDQLSMRFTRLSK